MRHPRLRTAAVLGLLLAAQPMRAADRLLLQDDIEFPTASQLDDKSFSGAAVSLGDYDNVHVLQVSGTYDRGMAQPRFDVVHAFLARHADAYDFLVVFTGFEFETEGALAFYNPVFNDVQGVGLDGFDFRELYGNSSRLQGYVDMAALERYAFDQASPLFRSPLETLTHELMHRWSVKLRYVDNSGQVSGALLGQDEFHWSAGVSSEASLMYGGHWIEQASGEWLLSETRQRLGLWDLYLAGLAEQSELQPITLLSSSQLDPRSIPQPGLQLQADRELIQPEQVIAAEGVRQPSAEESQREFTAALIYLVRPGQLPAPQDLAKLEVFRVAFERYFQSVTRGRAVIRLGLVQNPDHPRATPQPMIGSPGPPPSQPVEQAVTWLLAAQRFDGSWSDRPSTTARDTSAAIGLLSELLASSTMVQAARDWAAALAPANHDQRGWLQAAVPQRQFEPALIPNQDGGIGTLAGWISSPVDSIRSLVGSLAAIERDQPLIDQHLGFLLSQQNDDGSFGPTSGGRGRLSNTLLAARHLLLDAAEANQVAGTRARDWLQTEVTLSSINLRSHSLAELAELANAMQAVGFDPPIQSAILQRLRADQGQAGDWGGSVYTTALAAAALHRAEQPNLAAVTATIDPAQPVQGDWIRLRLRVLNSGGEAAPASELRWHDGDPASAATTVLASVDIPPLGSGSEFSAEVSLRPLLDAGDFDFHALLDASEAIDEGREDDNLLRLPVVIRPPPIGSELSLDSRDITTLPETITRVPSTVTVSAVVRNLGSTAVSQVMLRAEHIRDNASPTAIAESVLDVAAGAEAPFALELPIALPQAHRVRLTVDATDIVAEPNELNNQIELLIPFGNSVDLELLGDTLQVLPENAVLGDDLGVRVAVANRGTNDSGSTTLTLEERVQDDWHVRAEVPIAVDAGQQVQRELVWRPERDGSFELRLRIDPTNTLVEADESNNEHVFTVALGRSDSPNLVVLPASIQLTPAMPLQGAPLAVQARVKNLGESATAAFNAALYVGDPRSGGQRLTAVRLDAGLPPEAEATIDFQLDDLPFSGDLDLFVFADSELEVVERNESDNVGIRGITALRLPDLASAIGAIDLTPSSPAYGQPVTARISISNLGEQPSAPTTVRLFELAAGTRADIEPTVELPQLSPGAAFEAEWTWTFGLIESPQALLLQIDPDNGLRESNEQNNEFTLLLDAQDGDGFASERWFSPNGDGVKDRTTLIWSDGSDLSAARVFDHRGRERRRLIAFEPTGVDGASVVWDGADEDGRIVTDGRYRIVAEDSGGRVRAPIYTTVDTDQPMALEAVNGENGVLREWPSSVRPWVPALEGTSIEDFVYVAGHPSNPQLALRRGAMRFNVLTGATEPVITARWLDAHVAENGLVDLEPLQLLPLSDGRLLLAAAEFGGDNRTLLFVLQPNEIDKPQLLAAIDTRALQPLIAQIDAQRVLVGDAGEFGQRWIVDPASGTAIPVRGNDGREEILQVNRDGLVLSSFDLQRMDFVPFDALRPLVALPRFGGNVQGARVTFSDDGLQYLRHTLETVLGDTTGFETVTLIDVTTAAEHELARVPAPHAGAPEPPTGQASSKRRADEYGSWRRLRMLRTFWLEHRREAILVDHAVGVLRRFSPQGDVLGERTIPPSLRQGDYELAAFGQPGAISASFAAEAANPPAFCVGSAHPHWQASGNSRLGFQRARYADDVGSLYITHGEAVYAPDDGSGYDATDFACEGAVDYLRLDDDGDHRRLGGSTVWPLRTAVDRQAYPTLQLAGETPVTPPEWPRFIHRNGTLLRSDGRVDMPSLGTTSAPWSLATRLRDSNRSQTRLFLARGGAPAAEQIASASFSTLERLTGMLSALSDGRSVQLSGVATDRHFDHFAIDWARAATPEQWNVLVPATRSEIRFDDFIGWAPPDAGAYVFRLRVVDRAGNRLERFASAEVVAGSPLAGLRADHRHISPNGDAVQDSVTLSFTVVRPTQEQFEVRDDAGRVLRRQVLTFGTPELGPNQWSWDGRDDQGAAVPEGRYRLETSSGHALPVYVDRTPPVVVAALVQPVQVAQLDEQLPIPMTGGPGINFRIDERRAGLPVAFASMRIESSALDAEQWSELEPIRSGIDEAGQRAAQLSASQYVGRRFRIVAVDLAGNRTVRSAGSSAPTLRLIHGDLLRDWIPWISPDPGSPDASDYGQFVDIVTGFEFTPILISPETALFALNLADEPDQVVVEELVASGAPGELQWQAQGNAMFEAVDERGVLPNLSGHLLSAPVDLGGRLPGTYATLRLRARYADGSELTSNAVRFQLGGLVFDCGSGLRPPTSESFLESPISAHSMQFGRLEPGRFVVLGTELASEPRSRLARFSSLGNRGPYFRSLARDTHQRQIASNLKRCGGGSTSPGDGSGQASLEIVPQIAPLCVDQPTGQVLARVNVVEQDLNHRLLVQSPFLPQPFVHAIPSIGSLDLPIDVSAWPVGDYTAQLQTQFIGASGWADLLSANFVVDHTPPDAEWVSPVDGERICAASASGQRLLSTAEDASVFGMLVEVISNGVAEREASPGLICDNPPCALQTPSLRGFSGQHGIDHDRQLPVNQEGAVNTHRLRASDWSGAQICRTVSYSIDATAQIEERSAPLPLPPSGSAGMPAISTAAPDGPFRSAHWLLLARERVDLEVELYRGQRTANGTVEPNGSLLAILEVRGGVEQQFDYSWDGRIAGAAVDDGLYVIRFRAVDDCGNEGLLDRPLTVDSTAPTITIAQPAAGAQLRTVTLQIIAGFDDPHVERWRIEVSQVGMAGPWQLLAEGDRAYPTPTLLAQWPVAGALGPLWVRYSARDWLRNPAERIDQVTLLPRALVLQDARIEPSLFSPNADGRLDSTTIRLQVRLPARVSADVRTEDEQLVRQLAIDQPMPVGMGTLVWDGLGDDGSVVPDGHYVIQVRAVDAAIPETIDLQAMRVTIDNAAPALQGVSPPEGVVSCAEALSLEVDDPHLDRFDARLLREGSVVSSLGGTASGLHFLAPLSEFPEAAYRLEIEASDLAGNRTDLGREFVLDCTPPVAEVLLPVEHAVLPRAAGQSLAITGTALDDHLRDYRLTLTPAEPPSVPLDLVVRDQPVNAGTLFDWPVLQDDGDYRLGLIVDDLAGHRTAVEHELTIDGTPPVVAILSPAAGTEIGATLDLVGSAFDLNFSSYRVEIATPAEAAAGEWSPIFESETPVLSGSLASMQLANEGPLEVRLVALDAAGNTASARSSYVVDGQPPPAPQQLSAVVENNQNVRLQWQGAEVADLQTFVLMRNGIELARTGTLRNHLDLQAPEAPLTYVVHAQDRAGNLSPPSNAVTVRVDRTPPTVALFAPLAMERVRGVVSVRGAAHSDGDFASYRLSLQGPDGSLLETLRTSPTPNSGGLLHSWDTRTISDESALRLRLVAFDTSNNQASVEVAVVVDNQPPAAPAGLQAVEDGLDVQVSWDANSEPDLLGYLLYRNGQLAGFGGSLPADLRPLANPQNLHTDVDAPDGALSYRVYAIDQSGNVSAPSEPAQLVRDNGPPSLQIVRPQSGEEFGEAIEILAISDDTDIAQVEFAARAVGSPDWLVIGDPVGSAPWRAAFVPPALAYGEYQLRAIATDAGGRVDPDPPTVLVSHVDLTPPAQPQGLQARANGIFVTVSWMANSESDLAGYRIERLRADGQWQSLPAGLQTGTTVVESRPFGNHSYRVIAEDQRGNRSEPSAVDTAHVFTLEVEQPFTPVASPSVDVQGSAPSCGGVINFRIHSDDGLIEGQGPSVAATESFTVANLTLQPGHNEIELRIVDTLGNVSTTTSVYVQRGLIPEPPTHLQGTISGLDVELNWDASPSSEVAGYRVFRNLQAIVPDAPLAQSVDAYSPFDDVSALVDDDPDTGWSVAAQPGTAQLDERGGVELNWADTALVTGLRMAFASADRSVRAYRVSALDDEAGWIVLGERFVQHGVQQTMLFPAAYPTYALKVELLETQQPGATVELRGVTLLERTPQPERAASDAVIEGRYVYQVTAVSPLGFESQRSNEWIVEVGDVEPPPAVQLSGAIVDGAASLAWTESPAADLSHYVLHRDEAAIASIAAGSPRQHVDAALPDGHYRYHVTAVDVHQNASARSNEVSLQIANGGPAAPQITSVVQPGDELALQIAWTPGAGASPASYRLLVAENEAGPYDLLLALSGTDYLHRGLAIGRVYHYRVIAVDANGNLGPMSLPASGSVVDRLPPATPRLTYPTLPGAPVVWTASHFDVCGITSPMAAVTITVNGLADAQLPATAATATRYLPFTAYAAEALPSADGLSALVGAGVDNLPGWIDIATGDRLGDPAPGGGRWRLLRPLPDGRGAVAVSMSGSIYVSSPTSTRYRAQISGAPISDLAASPDAARVFVISDNGGGAQLLHHDEGASNFEQIELPPGVLPRAGSLRWRARDASLLFAATGGEVYRLDNASLDISPIGSAAERLGPYPAPVGGAWLVVDADGRLLRVDGDGLAPRTLRADGGDPLALAWSPDARRVAIRYADSLDIIDADDGTLIESTPANPTAAVAALHWSSAWTLLASGPSMSAELTDVAGAFCARDLLTRAGLNTVQAIARNAIGLTSDSSEALQLEHPTPAPDDVDLLLRGEDLRLFPAGARLGDQAIVYATLRNLGQAAVVLSPTQSVHARVTGPAGTFDLPVQTSATAVAGGGSASLTVDLGRPTIAGDYRVELTADPDNLLAELDETNNSASRTWRIDHSGAPQLAITAERYAWAPGEGVRGTVEVANGGSLFNGALVLHAVDGDGLDQGSIATFALPALASGQLRRFDWQWAPGQFAHGPHRVVATLRAATGQALLERAAEVSIASVAELGLLLSPASVSHPLGTPLPIDIGVDFLSGNLPLFDGRLTLLARLQGGTDLMLWSGATGALLPGYTIRRSVLWPAASQVAGNHQLLLRFVDAASGVQRETSRNLQLNSVSAPIAPRGQLQLAPLPRLLLGGPPAELRANVYNDGEQPISELAVRLVVRTDGQALPLIERDWSISLAAGMTDQRSESLAALPQQLLSHVATLQARLPGDPPGVWRTLDTLGFSAADGLPPEIALIAPDPTRPHRLPVPLAARIHDRHSRVERSWYRVDGGEWRSLSSDGLNGHDALLHALADGAHRIDLRAQDLWTNEALSLGHAFTVDATAPTIQISGVQDGELRNDVVTPVIAVQDVHLASVSAQLDDASFESATPIDTEGAHTLRVLAEDQAGNRAQRQLQFTIDRTPPAIAFSSPEDGTSTVAAAIDVVIATEPGARVRFDAGGFGVDAIADSLGAVTITAVPLQVGNNLLQASATDAAQNRSDVIGVNVLREKLGGELSGRILLSTTSLAHGEALAAQIEVLNSTAAVLDPLPTRLTAIDAGLVELYAETRVLSLPAGAGFDWQPDLAAEDWDFGAVTLRLEADAGQGFVTLDAVVVNVVDVLPPQLTPLQPAAASVQPRPTAMRVAISDDRAVTLADYRIDGGAWLPLDDLGDGLHGVDSTLPDGPHEVQYRASDAAGNATQSENLAFVVDGTPPQIVVDGVVAGGLYGQPVAVDVQVIDVHPATLDIELNGLAYLPMTPITSSGAYTLQVVAEDLAGNRSERSLSFTLDLDPPTLVFVEPLPDAIITVDHVTVIGSTEPEATVHLSAAGFAVQLIAKTDGSFSVANVPLQPGENILRAHAVDAVGNVGSEQSLRVFHSPGNSIGLVGALTLNPADVAQGAGFAANFEIGEIAGIVRDPLPARILVRRAGGSEPLLQVTRSLTLAAGQSVAGSEAFDSTTLALGNYVVALQVEIAGQWHELASAALRVLDLTPPALAFVAPPAGSLHATVADLRVHAIDSGSVARVEARVEGGDWLELQSAGNDEWTVALPLPWEGEIRIEARATDAAGNTSVPLALDVLSDQSPPLIVITGVADGLRASTAVAAQIEITDASSFTSTITLDGQPYVSGTLISAQGDHLLSVEAEDLLGHRSSRQLRFSISIPPTFIPSLRVEFAVLGILALLLTALWQLARRRSPR